MCIQIIHDILYGFKWHLNQLVLKYEANSAFYHLNNVIYLDMDG